MVIAATAAVGKLWFFGDSHPTASYPFAPASYNTGLVVNRTWTLSGDHGQELQATVTLANGLSGPLSGAFDEVIPKTVAGLDSAVEFNPLPDQVVQSDPVVRFKYYLTKGATTDIHYTVDIGPTTGSLHTRLVRLANDQATAQAAYLKQIGQPAPATLAAVSVLPNALALQVGQVLTATVTGVMSNGASAAPAALQGVQWTTADHSIAIVDHATITAVGPGTTTISAEAGGLRAEVSVSVSGTMASYAGVVERRRRALHGRQRRRFDDAEGSDHRRLLRRRRLRRRRQPRRLRFADTDADTVLARPERRSSPTTR